jgi:hypothetical protein
VRLSVVHETVYRGMLEHCRLRCKTQLIVEKLHRYSDQAGTGRAAEGSDRALEQKTLLKARKRWDTPGAERRVARASRGTQKSHPSVKLHPMP